MAPQRQVTTSAAAAGALGADAPQKINQLIWGSPRNAIAECSGGASRDVWNISINYDLCCDFSACGLSSAPPPPAKPTTVINTNLSNHLAIRWNCPSSVPDLVWPKVNP